MKTFLILVCLGCSFAADLPGKTITLKGSTDVKLPCPAAADYTSVEWKFKGIGAVDKICTAPKGHTSPQDCDATIKGTKIVTTTGQEDLQITKVDVTNAGLYTCTVTPKALATPTPKTGQLAIIEDKINCTYGSEVKTFTVNEVMCSMKVRMNTDATFVPAIKCTHTMGKPAVTNNCPTEKVTNKDGTYSQKLCLIPTVDGTIDLQCDSATFGTGWAKNPTGFIVKNKQEVAVEKLGVKLECTHEKKVTLNSWANITCKFSLGVGTTSRPSKAELAVKMSDKALDNKCKDKEIPKETEVKDFEYKYCTKSETTGDMKVSFNVDMAGVTFDPTKYDATIKNSGSTVMLFWPLLTSALVWTVMNMKY